MAEDFAEALRAALSDALGFPIAPLERLDGRTTLNFRAVRETDGMTFAVKCAPPKRYASFRRIARYIDQLGDGGGKTARRLFAGRFDTFREYQVMCLSWCDGERLFPDRLTDGQAVALTEDYLRFSAALQRVVPADPPVDYAAMRLRGLSDCRGVWSGRVRGLLEAMTEERLTVSPERRRIVHGDLHHGNFLFRDGRVSGFFDFENVTEGCPAEDFIRYFVCASEHLRWYEQHRKLRILRVFGIVVATSPYPLSDWELAIDRALTDKICHKVRDRGCGFLMSVNLLFRARYYGKLKRVAAEACARRNLKEG